MHIRARKALIERYKLSAGEKTSYSICLSTLIAVTNIAWSTLDSNRFVEYWREFDRMYWDTEKIIILAACMYWDSWKSNYFWASQYTELLRVVSVSIGLLAYRKSNEQIFLGQKNDSIWCTFHLKI